jgi:hypothetical protein
MDEGVPADSAALLPTHTAVTSASPAGSLGKMLHHLRDHTEGAMPTFLL